MLAFCRPRKLIQPLCCSHPNGPHQFHPLGDGERGAQFVLYERPCHTANGVDGLLIVLFGKGGEDDASPAH